MKAAMDNDDDAGPAAGDDDDDATVDLRPPVVDLRPPVVDLHTDSTLSVVPAADQLETSLSQVQPPPPPQPDDTRDMTTEVDNGQLEILLFQCCFSTGVPQNLRVPPVAFKGFAELNYKTGIKRHLQPLDAFSWLLVRPKCLQCSLDP